MGVHLENDIKPRPEVGPGEGVAMRDKTWEQHGTCYGGDETSSSKKGIIFHNHTIAPLDNDVGFSILVHPAHVFRLNCGPAQKLPLD